MSYILGIDEVGRGAWAGPLVVGACLLNGAIIEGLTDSKKLTKLKKVMLYLVLAGLIIKNWIEWDSASLYD